MGHPCGQRSHQKDGKIFGVEKKKVGQFFGELGRVRGPGNGRGITASL